MEKIVNDYLFGLFEKINPYQLSKEDLEIISKDKIDFLFGKMKRKKFRRKLTPKTEQNIKEKIAQSLKENRPLHFVIPFGGYKHFWNSSYPEPDWAEIFNFRFMTEYFLPILATYEPGVILEYISEDLIINRMNNYPLEVIERYSEVFNKIVEWYKQFAPNNLQIKYFRIGKRCDKNKVIEEVEKVLPERIAAFNKLSEDKKSQELRRSTRSVMWNGEKDLTSLGEKEKYQRIVESRQIELAYYETEAKPEVLGNYLWEDNHICVCFSFGLSPDNTFEDLSLASNFGSIVDYWIGRGILEYKNGRLIPKTVSKNQYQELKPNLKEIEINPQLLPFKNFQKIEVLTNQTLT